MTWAIVALVAAAAAAGFLAGRRMTGAPPAADARHEAHEIEVLKAGNALLRELAGSPDITGNLPVLARRIPAIVPCDRVGLALLTEDRQGYSTFTARLADERPRSVAGPELHFPRRSSVIDEVVSAREGRVVDDVAALAPSYLDVNVVRSAGFQSLVLVPLIFEGEALGTLNLVSRRPGAFTSADLHALTPVAEALASAYGTRRLAHAYARRQMGTELSDLTFAFANDMSGAVQAIIGQCELLAHAKRDLSIERELAGMLQQARRLRDILSQMQRMTREQVSTHDKPQ